MLSEPYWDAKVTDLLALPTVVTSVIELLLRLVLVVAACKWVPIWSSIYYYVIGRTQNADATLILVTYQCIIK